MLTLNKCIAQLSNVQCRPIQIQSNNSADPNSISLLLKQNSIIISFPTFMNQSVFVCSVYFKIKNKCTVGNGLECESNCACRANFTLVNVIGKLRLMSLLACHSLLNVHIDKKNEIIDEEHGPRIT